MGKLLLFAKTRRPNSEPFERDKDAELVVFTGIRYERQTAEDEPPPNPRPQCENDG